MSYDATEAFKHVRWTALTQGAPRLDDLDTRALDEAGDAEEAAMEHEETEPEATIDRRLDEIDAKYDADREEIYAMATDEERAAVVAGELEGIRTLLQRKMMTTDEARTAIQAVRERWGR